MDCVEVFSKAHLAMLPQSLVVRDEEFKNVERTRGKRLEIFVMYVGFGPLRLGVMTKMKRIVDIHI